MKNILENQIQGSLLKVRNLRIQSQEIEDKVRKLESQLEGIRNSLEKEKIRIQTLGQKSIRRDGKPETPETLSEKNEFNQNLYKEKLLLIQRHFPEFYQEFEESCPSILKDENLQKELGSF